MYEKLDVKDRKILYELELDARQPYSKIAKRVGLSKEVVKYRVDRLVEKKIIEKFVLIVNGTKLGYYAYKFYIQLQNINKEELNKLIEDINLREDIVWIATSDGKYDLIIAPIARNNNEAFSIQNEIMKKHGKYIKELLPLNYIDAKHQKRSYLINKIRNELNSPFWGDTQKKYKLDKYEIQILSILCEDTRKQVTEIALQLNCSVDIVHKRIKRLVKEKVIEGSRIMINKSKIGYQYHKLLLNIKFDNKQEENKFFTYLRKEKNIIDIIRMMGNWNFELDIDVKNATEFHEIIMDLKNNFPRNILSYEALLIFKEHKYNLFPQGKSMLSTLQTKLNKEQ